jgi:NitT/TauT family transport system permease protein
VGARVKLSQIQAVKTVPLATPSFKRRWLEYKRTIPWHWSLVLGVMVWSIFIGFWEFSSISGWANELFLPPPSKVLATLYSMISERGYLVDIGVSIYRILLSFAMACIIAIPLGLLMGSFSVVDALFKPVVSAWRYLPAPAFIPLLLMWLGAGEGSKLALLFIGVVFFLVALIADHTRAVRTELLETAMTLGANRWQVLATVIFPAVAPNIVISMRQLLAVSWTYLVIAEIVASSTGIGAVMMRGQRFLKVDEIMAGVVTIGVLGLIFDFIFELGYRRLFSYVPRRNV